jgi:AmmeMemoRadiSam system protein A
MLPQPNNPVAGTPHSHRPESTEFDRQERAQLLHAAHESIRAALEGKDIPLHAPSPHLEEPRGVFTTLYLREELRGCVGYVFPIIPLYRAVAETARAAAFDDTRFYSLTRVEEPGLEVSLSILSALQPIRVEEVEIGRHGLMVSMGGNRGLLLPQVPVEHKWDRITFLEQTCRKAGLGLDVWKKGALIEAFTAEVFCDKDVHQ